TVGQVADVKRVLGPFATREEARQAFLDSEVPGSAHTLPLGLGQRATFKFDGREHAIDNADLDPSWYVPDPAPAVVRLDVAVQHLLEAVSRLEVQAPTQPHAASASAADDRVHHGVGAGPFKLGLAFPAVLNGAPPLQSPGNGPTNANAN